MGERTEISDADDGPLVCSLSDFLCDCDGPDPWCKQHFDDYIGDIDQAPDDEMHLLEAVEPAGTYALTLSTDSVLLLHREGECAPWSVVGYYSTPGAVCIKDEHQGNGLGAELILYTALNWSGGPPTAGLDEQMFSESGYAAHAAAWRLGVERGLISDPEAKPSRTRTATP